MEQFEERQKRKSGLEDEMVVESFQRLADVVADVDVGKGLGSPALRLFSVMKDLSRVLRVPLPAFPASGLSEAEYREQYFRPRGIMWRKVLLKDRWYEDAAGVMLGTLRDGTPAALIPASGGGYRYRDPWTGKTVRVTRANAEAFQPEATLYYRSLPTRAISARDIRNFIRDCVSPGDGLLLVAATLAVILLAMVTPAMTNLLLSDVTKTANDSLLRTIFVMLVIAAAASFLMTAVKELLLARICDRVAVPLQAAFMMRILTAPSGKLRSFAAGDLGSRVGTMYLSVRTLLNMSLSMMLTAACSFVCFFQMFSFAAGPAAIALGVTAVLLALYVFVMRKQAAVSADRMTFQAAESGLTYSLIGGMRKITLAGAEKRAFSHWAEVYRQAIGPLYNPPLLLKVFTTLTPVILLAGTMGMYQSAFSDSVSRPAFSAFLASWGLLTGALTVIGSNAIPFADALPVFRVLRPVMDFEPEIEGQKETVKELKGDISLRNLYFRYSADAPQVLENLNIEIHSGEYAALVGMTGCGKSTVLRLLLGLEKPNQGEVCYDGRNLSTLDVVSLRRRIGTVLQDGEIFEGTILSNITIGGTDLTEADAWAAAETAGIAEDIRRLPLGMNTPLPAGGRGVSGGQKQRLMIARAIAGRPSVLFFDEATSALDNVTQKAVTDAISAMRCTRLVIAHRLSTVQDCDRILCLDQGHVVEEGTYEELLKKGGFFAELVRRQQV